MSHHSGSEPGFGRVHLGLGCCLLLFSRSVMPDSCETPWTVAHQAPVSMGSPRQECWSRLPFSSPGDLPDPGVEPASLALALELFTPEPGDVSAPLQRQNSVLRLQIPSEARVCGK